MLFLLQAWGRRDTVHEVLYYLRINIVDRRLPVSFDITPRARRQTSTEEPDRMRTGVRWANPRSDQPSSFEHGSRRAAGRVGSDG
jgi:hypothetical protein